MDRSLFFFNAHTIDKLLCMRREGGVHLYRTHLLDKAISLVGLESVTVKPESHLVHAMEDIGYPRDRIRIPVTLHDYEQYYRDIFRTILTHTNRHQLFLQFLVPIWRELAPQDDDYKVALWAYETSQIFKVNAKLDARDFLQSMDDILSFLGLSEKMNTIENIEGKHIHEKLNHLSNDVQLQKYSNQLQKIKFHPRRHPRYWLMKAGQQLSSIGNYMQSSANKL